MMSLQLLAITHQSLISTRDTKTTLKGGRGEINTHGRKGTN